MLPGRRKYFPQGFTVVNISWAPRTVPGGQNRESSRPAGEGAVEPGRRGDQPRRPVLGLEDVEVGLRGGRSVSFAHYILVYMEHSYSLIGRVGTRTGAGSYKHSNLLKKFYSIHAER
jgi:hypothetical protein